MTIKPLKSMPDKYPNTLGIFFLSRFKEIWEPLRIPNPIPTNVIQICKYLANSSAQAIGALNTYRHTICVANTIPITAKQPIKKYSSVFWKILTIFFTRVPLNTVFNATKAI